MDKKSNSMISKIMKSYAFTFMMIELADSLSMLTDGLIVSNLLGSTALASVGLGNTSFQMISLFCGIFAIGIQSCCSSFMGSGNREMTEKAFSSGLTVVTAVAVLCTVFGFLFRGPLCVLLGADRSDEELFNTLYRYLSGWFVGIPGFIGFTVLSPIVTLDGNKKCVTAATVVQSVFNVGFDLFSIKVLKWDMYGPGFATGFGFDLALLVLLSNFLRKRSSFRLRFSIPDAAVLGRIFKIGAPRLTKYGCKMLAPLLINRTIIAVGGCTAMAAMSVKSSIGNFCFVAGNGFAESVNLMSQVFYSEKDKQALKTTVKTAANANLIICTVFAVVMLIGARLLAGLFMAEGTVEYDLTVLMMRCLALSVALNGLNSEVMSYLQGTRKMIPTHLQTISHRLVFPAAATFILGSIMGTKGLFIALPVGEILVLAAYIISALLHGRGSTVSDALLLLPDDFGYRSDDSMSISLRTMDEVVGISERINDFCLKHGIDRRRAYYSALCVEELAGNVVDHGFKKDSKQHSCEVRVMIEDDDVILRIRDDCRYFNIKERYELLKNKDPMSDIGIKLVYGIAKDVNYVNILNTNTLIIRI